MPAVFGVACFIAMFWSAVRYQVAYNSVVDSLPPQFQEDLTSRYAFPVYVLEPSTPLHVQAEYMKSMWGSCAGALLGSLCFFSYQNYVFGGFVLIVFAFAMFSTTKAWRTYRDNCSRAVNRDVEEQS